MSKFPRVALAAFVSLAASLIAQRAAANMIVNGRFDAIFVVPVPESSTAALVGLGVAALVQFSRRSRERRQNRPDRVLLMRIALFVTTAQALAVDVRADSLPLTCGGLQARIYDGVPGPGVLLASSSSGCPSEASAVHLHGDADASARVALEHTALLHEHIVDIKSSATTRISVSEAYLSIELSPGVTELQLFPSFSVDPLRFSSVLQLEESSSSLRITLVAGSPLLPGESTVWQDSQGAIVPSSLVFPAGSRVQVYSRIASYGEVRHTAGLTFASVPEPCTLLLLAVGFVVVATHGRRRMSRPGNWACGIAIVALSSIAIAAPISVGGLTFSAGEDAFADGAVLISGSLNHTCAAGPVPAAASLSEALTGSDIRQCVNTSDSVGGIAEVFFSNNTILNDAGVDLVIFELSGPQAPGTADARERFGISVSIDGVFSPFLQVDPIATGFNSITDPTLDIFSVQVDLSSFGVPAASSTDRVRLHIRNNNLGTRSADIAALGALHSGPPVPEGATGALLAAGLAALAIGSRMRRRVR